VLALVITQAAAESERKLVGAARIAVSITSSGNPADPRLAPLKQEMLRLVREGIAINPHYRKITPIVADELARWGDWANATWIWDSVLTSRPYVVAIISNAARGYASMGRTDKALAYLERAKRIQPRAPAVRSLEVILLARNGDEARATRLAREAYDAGIRDYDLVNGYFMLAWRARDFALARQLLDERMRAWPESRPRGLMQLGLMATEQNQDERALRYFREGLAAAPPAQRAALVEEIPPALRARVAASAPQTSASSR
jgi:tetratricopeptide (TPR) repeat protein